MKIVVDRIETLVSDNGSTVVRGKGNVAVLVEEEGEVVWMLERPMTIDNEWTKKVMELSKTADLN